MKEILNSKITSNSLWTIFGIINGLSYYSREEYLISAVMWLIGVLYGYNTVKSIIENKNEKNSL